MKNDLALLKQNSSTLHLGYITNALITDALHDNSYLPHLFKDNVKKGLIEKLIYRIVIEVFNENWILSVSIAQNLI